MIPGQQLRIDYETHTAAVRTFVERQFGRETLPDPKTGSVVDLVMSEGLPEDVIGRVLGEAGFRNVPAGPFQPQTSGRRRGTAECLFQVGRAGL